MKKEKSPITGKAYNDMTLREELTEIVQAYTDNRWETGHPKEVKHLDKAKKEIVDLIDCYGEEIIQAIQRKRDA